jgi:hypothetical protein
MYSEYMNRKRQTSEGVRASDNWQKGIPKEVLMQSLLRHVMDLWLHHRDGGAEAVEDESESLCAMFFNVQALMLDYLRQSSDGPSRHEDNQLSLLPGLLND